MIRANIPIEQIRKKHPIRLLGDITNLLKHIKEHGHCKPLRVTRKFVLIDGYRRLAALEILGATHVDVYILGVNND